MDTLRYSQAVITNWIFGGLVSFGLGLLLWQWTVARRYPLHHRLVNQDRARNLLPVTLLKPLKGVDNTTAENLRSWFSQDYPNALQILFGVASEDDPVCDAVHQLLKEFPNVDARLVICNKTVGANPKVSTLVQLERFAKHDVIVVSDSDVRASPDLLINLVARLSSESRSGTPEFGDKVQKARETLGATSFAAEPVGLVCCLYRIANPVTAAMRWEAVAVNVDFWSQVLQARSITKLDFALGAVMAVRREALSRIGGFAALADFLADDYYLGHKIANAGWQIDLCPVVVDCWSAPVGWKTVWEHQLRWARTIRASKPVPYFFSILSDVTAWALLWLLTNPTGFTLLITIAIVLVRLHLACVFTQLLTQTRARSWLIWAVPLKDILQIAIWLLAFTGRTIKWQGARFRLSAGGILRKTG